MLTARLNDAMALLHETHLAISEIAEASGFDSPYSFSRAFKQATGEAPSRFRDRVQETGAYIRSTA